MMQFQFPVIELVDRYTIARVKFRRLAGANAAELEFYQQQIQQLNLQELDQDLQKLESVHEKIWDMEDDFKKCRLADVDLAEIGRRALAIRDLNNYRVDLKNSLAGRVNSQVTEIKKYGKD
jgi:hypothetical protein